MQFKVLSKTAIQKSEIAQLETDRDILARYINGTLDEVGLGFHHVEEVLNRVSKKMREAPASHV